MRRRLSLLWLIALFFSTAASAQEAPFGGGYHAWQRPFLAYNNEAENWIAAYVSPEGQAYEYRNKAGDLLVVHVRYQGECFRSADALAWRKDTCHMFIKIDAMFRDALIRHQQRQNAGRTDE